jgi:hypothetical protein
MQHANSGAQRQRRCARFTAHYAVSDGGDRSLHSALAMRRRSGVMAVEVRGGGATSGTTVNGRTQKQTERQRTRDDATRLSTPHDTTPHRRRRRRRDATTNDSAAGLPDRSHDTAGCGGAYVDVESNRARAADVSGARRRTRVNELKRESNAERNGG